MEKELYIDDIMSLFNNKPHCCQKWKSVQPKADGSAKGWCFCGKVKKRFYRLQNDNRGIFAEDIDEDYTPPIMFPPGMK